MAENKSNARVKKTLQSSKELAKTTRENVVKEKDKILETIKNNIVDRRIDKKEAELRRLAEMYDENEVDAINALKSDEVLEKKKLSEEYESIVKKQLQMLKADERGKQALLNEISEIKQQQRKRSEALKSRKKALLVEKERSKRVAALPPPLPRSVKLLLKEQEKIDSEAPSPTQSFYHHELSSVEEEFEDKENMDEEAYHEQRRRMQEEWDRKAKKRFNEAIRKDKQKQEHAQILKEIENAEKINRRQMAKNLSEPSGKVPCTLSDRLNHVDKQAVLEDAVESIYKKARSTKEHAIEDLEGYEDKWEAKYKQIDSNLESKMIDCVPSFVKHNYSYLLEDEPAQQCGNRFTRLDDSADELNMAYIESPTEPISSSDRITAVITHLDQMMSESNEVYERQFKPLLEAEILKGDLPKLESFDKAVEANILRLPTEDKAVDVHEEVPIRSTIPSATRGTQADFMNSGIMAFKRKSPGSKYKSYLGSLSDPHVQSPSWMDHETAHPNGSWSSSSYRSLPSKHGQPDICKLCDSPSCRLPLVEDKSFHRDCIPLSKNLQKEQAGISDGESTTTDVRSKISSYVQLVADKYLKKTPVELKSQEQVDISGQDEVHLNATGTPEQVVTGYHSDYSVGGSKEFDLKACHSMPSSDAAIDISFSGKVSQKSKSQQVVLPQIPPYSDKKSADMPNQDEFVKRCHEILTEKLSNIFSGEDGADSEVLSALKSAISDDVSQETKRKLTPGEFVYHELSTILEMDSALTNDMPSLQDASKRSDASGSSSISSISRMSDGLISPEEVDTTSVSLVDVPLSEASELAKSIRFVAESSDKPLESAPQVNKSKTSLSLISGTLTTIQTPSPRSVSEVPKLTKSKIVTESSEKPSKSASQVLEPKTPPSLLSGILSDVPTPSPRVVIEAPTPKSIASTEHLKTPSSVTLSDVQSSISSTLKSARSYSSRDLLTPTSQLSAHSHQSEVAQLTPYSSSFRFANLQYPFLTSLTNELPEYFRDVSSIKQSSSPSESRSAENMKPTNDGQTVPKAVRAPCKQIFFPEDFDGKFGADENSSGSFKPMTLHSNVSSPGTMHTGTDNKSGSSKEGNVPPREHSLPKSTSNPPQSLGSGSSFKPMTPHSYMSNPAELPGSREELDAFRAKDGHKVSSSRKSIGSQGTDDDNFQPMTPHTYVSSNVTSQRQEDVRHKTQTSNFPSQQHLDSEGNNNRQGTYSKSQKGGRDAISGKSSSNDFHPMTPHSNISTPNLPSQSSDPDSESEYRTFSTSQKMERYFNSAKNNASGFQPMTPHYSLSTPNLPPQRHNRVSETKDSQHEIYSISQKEQFFIPAKNSNSGFQPMTSHSHISKQNPLSQEHDLDSERKGSQHKGHSTSQKEEGFLSAQKSASGFQPMTPHSHISSQNSPSQGHNLYSERKDSQHKGHSTPQKEEGFLSAQKSASGFQPMTPHSYISSQNPLSQGHDLGSERKASQHKGHSTSQEEEGFLSAQKSASGFQPMTPHSHISSQNSPSQGHDLDSERKESQHKRHSTSQKEEGFLSAQKSTSGFQPMTPHSYLSTPNLPSQTHKSFDTGEKCHRSTSVPLNEGKDSVATEISNGFQAMTPHSYISSPDGNTNISSEDDLRVHSSSSVSLRLRISRNLISGTTTSGSDVQGVSDDQNKDTVATSGLRKSLKLRFGIKDPKYLNPDEDVEDYLLGDGSHLQQDLLVGHPLKNDAYEDVDGKNSRKGFGLKKEDGVKDINSGHKALRFPKSDLFVPQLSADDLAIAEDAQEGQKLKKPAKVCSSDFFTPQLSSSDYPRLQKGYFSSVLSDCPEISSVGSSDDLKTSNESTPSISSVMSWGGKSLTNNKELLRILTSSSKEGSGSLSPSSSGTPYLSVDSPNPILEALRKKFASNPSSKASSLKSTPCCSQETLSDISVSKVNYQSTPIKTIDEIIQETGILDEPDLTLMTTELTMKPESPEKTRHFSEKCSAREDIIEMSTATQNNTDKAPSLAKTPTAGAAASYSESPSMMSFLQHENSCFGDSKIGAYSDLNHYFNNEMLMHEDEYGQRFGKNKPKHEYKERTKRLYNNLDEVKTKKMNEEKSKKIKENLLRRKAYSKIYNKSKKAPDH